MGISDFLLNWKQGETCEGEHQYIIQYIAPDDDPNADPSMEGVPMEIQTVEGEPVQASPLNWRQGQTGEDEPVQASTPNWKQGETGKDEPVQASTPNWKQGETGKDEPVQNYSKLKTRWDR